MFLQLYTNTYICLYICFYFNFFGFCFRYVSEYLLLMYANRSLLRWFRFRTARALSLFLFSTRRIRISGSVSVSVSTSTSTSPSSMCYSEFGSRGQCWRIQCSFGRLWLGCPSAQFSLVRLTIVHIPGLPACLPVSQPALANRWALPWAHFARVCLFLLLYFELLCCSVVLLAFRLLSVTRTTHGNILLLFCLSHWCIESMQHFIYCKLTCNKRNLIVGHIYSSPHIVYMVSVFRVKKTNMLL